MSPMALAQCSFKFPNIICSFKPKKPPPSSTSKWHITPATDRVIDFGKYKGKMLGALPSTYLKWVSNNLRAGDFEHWAKLADQVLEDPVYQDRLEWEFADSVLNGNKNASLSMEDSAVSTLLEISERFGWDNDDKVGWSKLNFELLGTSKGGRIPRICSNVKEMKDLGTEKEEKDRILSENEIRRKERRERARLRSTNEKKQEKLGILRRTKDSFVNGVREEMEQRSDQEEWTAEIKNPFPGREALLKKVLQNKKLF